MPRFGVQVAIDLNLIFVYHCYGKLAAMATNRKSLFQLFEDIESSNLVYRYFLTREIFFYLFWLLDVFGQYHGNKKFHSVNH